MGRYVGNKAFYRKVLYVAVPIMVQNGITNFVNLLDNIMVGQVGTVQMTGVSVVNQLLFVFNLAIFGAVSGAGIFTAQFHGNGDTDGVRDSFRYKLLTCVLLTAVGIGILAPAGGRLVSLYLQGQGDVQDAAATLQYGLAYMRIMFLGLLPSAVCQAYAGTLRETGQTVLPMKAGITAVFVNLIFNYILIYGKLGVPAMGVNGAAMATVLARFVELAIVVIWTHRHTEKNRFITHIYRDFRIPGKLAAQITLKGMPLMINETLWAGGMAIISQCYSLRGLYVIAATNISSTIWNVFSISFMALGNAVGIIVGHLLGANRMEEAKDTVRKLMAFSVITCSFFGIAMALLGPEFPRIYKTTQQVRDLAASLIIIGGLIMPLNAFSHASYFTLRSGGKTWITFLFDSCFVWTVCIPTAYFLSRYTTLPMVQLYLIVQLLEGVKCIIGYVMLKKGVWLHNITASVKQ